MHVNVNVAYEENNKTQLTALLERTVHVINSLGYENILLLASV